MKANEIQIGDLLYYKGQFNAFPFKVESITKKKVGYHAEPNEHRMHYLRLSECKPIPLVPEILEKNGFEKESKLFICGVKDFYLGYWIDDKVFEVQNLNELNEVSITCDCVHQLQHALRLCGISREIEL